MQLIIDYLNALVIANAERTASDEAKLDELNNQRAVVIDRLRTYKEEDQQVAEALKVLEKKQANAAANNTIRIQ